MVRAIWDRNGIGTVRAPACELIGRRETLTCAPTRLRRPECPRRSSIPRCSATFSPRRRCGTCSRTRTACRNISISRRRWRARRASSASSRRTPPPRSCAIATAKKIDMAKLKEATERIGYPVLPVVQQLVKLCKDGLGEWSHWGATTQDITDTATVMQIREALDIVEKEIDAIADALAALAKKYRDTPMAGRSNLQQAVPITFGYKMATMLGAFERHKQRLKELQAARAGGRIRRRRRHAVLARQGRAEGAGRADEGAQARPARYFLAHRARPHRRGRLLPRPGHRHLRQDRLRREAADADRGGRSLRAVPPGPRLVLDHAAEAQSDLVGLHHRADRHGEAAGRRAAGGAGRGPRALHRPVGNRMDRAAGNLHAVGRRAGADALPGRAACRSTKRRCARTSTSPRA